MGLREQIKNANSESEISSLLLKGKDFEFASNITRQAWKSTARYRLAELISNDSAKTPIVPNEAKKPSKKKKDKN